jgi:hypothetical protein
MSLRMTSKVWSDESITDSGEGFVMLVLADSHNPNHGCFPDLKTISKKARMTEKGVIRIIDRLIGKGKLTKVKGGGRGRPNSFKFCYETLTRVSL